MLLGKGQGRSEQVGKITLHWIIKSPTFISIRALGLFFRCTILYLLSYPKQRITGIGMDKETSPANTALVTTGSIRTVTGWILDNYWDDK